MTKSKIIIFGASESGQKISQRLGFREELISFADNSPSKTGQIFCGYSVITPEDILNADYDFIRIASHYWYEIYPQLRKLGIESEKIEIADLDDEQKLPWGLFSIIGFVLTVMIIYIFFILPK
jgi:hypothetical protein